MIWIMFGVALAFSLYAQWKVSSTFKKYASIPNHRGVSGAEVAEAMLSGYGTDAGIEQNAQQDSTRMALRAVAVQQTPGALTDHYDPTQRVLRLSEPVYGGRSIAAVSVAAHEAGHAMQHAAHYPFLSLRSLVVPIAHYGTSLAFPIVIIGSLLGMFPQALELAIFLYTGVVAFTLITLPVEFNASHRALKVLASGGYLTDDEELRGARATLNAAALTYVAASFSAVVSLLHLLMLRQD